MTNSHDGIAGQPSDQAQQAQERAARAVKAAVTVATAHGLRVDEPIVLANAYGLRVHLRPAPVVARVATLTAHMRTPIEPWLARELSVTEFLVSRGAPVVPPSGELPPGPHTHDGLSVSFWQQVEVIPDRLATPAETGPMLAELHAVLREYPGELPFLGPPLNDIPRGLKLLDGAGTLDPGDLAMLRAAYDRLEPLLRAQVGPLQPLHGDAHPGNLLVTTQGLLWNDFEDTCLGPIAWDLALMAITDKDVVSAYPDPPDPAELQLYTDARLLQLATWLPALPPVFPGHDAALTFLLDHWRARN